MAQNDNQQQENRAFKNIVAQLSRQKSEIFIMN